MKLRLFPVLCRVVLILSLLLSCSVVGFSQAKKIPPTPGALTYYDVFLGEDVPFPASVPVEIQQQIVSPTRSFTSKSLSLGAAQMSVIPPGYTLLDSIPPGSLGTTWSTSVNQPGPNPIPYRSEVISPYDGSTALRQQVIGNTYSWCTFFYLERYFDVGECLPGSRLAFFMEVNRSCSSCYYDAAGVWFAFLQGDTPVAYQAFGTAGAFNPWGLSLPNGFSGIIDTPVDVAFNRVHVYISNYACIGNNYTIFDHLMLKRTDTIDVEAIPDTLYIDQSGGGSGIVFRAKTSAATTVTFKVKTPSNQVIVIGSKATTQSGTDHVAKLSWWGTPALEAGEYTIIAEANGNSNTAAFTVKRVKFKLLGMGTWMTHTKDPAAVLPEPEAEVCPLNTWEQAIGEKEGYTDGLNLSDPVNPVSGNFFLPQVDLTIKSRLPLTLARIYNSLDSRTGPFGRGWSSPFFSHLEFLATDVVFVNSDGSQTLFKLQNNQFIAPESCDLTLSLTPATNIWKISHPNGLEWSFNSSGKIIRMARGCCGMGAADAVTVDYDANGKLYRITNPAGQWFEFTHNAEGLITKVTDSAGRNLNYGYDSDSNLVSFTDQIGQNTTFTYSDDGFLTSVTAPGNRTTSISYVDRRVSLVTAPDGAITHLAWDFSNQKMTLTDPAGVVYEYYFTPDWQLSSYAVPSLGISKSFVFSDSALTGYTNALGQASSYVYGADGLIQSITDVMGNTTSYEWQPTLHKLTKKIDTLGREWHYKWCSRGNLISEINPAGGVVSYLYDGHNNRTSRRDALGRVTRYEYEPGGNYLIRTVDALLGVSNFSYDNRGNLITSSDQLGRVTIFQYDLLDRLTKTLYPDGRFTEIEYDVTGNVALRRDNLGRETHYNYNISGQLVSTTRPDGTVFAANYDSNGRKISETDYLGRTASFEYNDVGQLTKTIFADGSFETFQFDLEGRLIARADVLGNITKFEYDPLGRLLATIDPTGARWESQYDSVGRKVSDRDPLNRVTTYQFDNLDRLTKVIRPDNSFVTNTFDAVGNLLSTVDALGNVWSWSYDNSDGQIKAVQPNGASSTTTFDAAGQVVAETDALGRTTQYAFDYGGRRASTTDSLGNIWRNFYDNAGRLTKVQDPTGAGHTMTYDNMDRVISEADPLGNVTSYEFDAAGRRVARTDASGRRSLMVFDLRDRLTNEVDPEGHTVSYGYDLAGQRISLTDGANRVWRWEYDSLGRVTAEIDPVGNINRYGFDSVGNRITWTNARNQVTNYTFNVMNRQTQITYPDGTLANMTYDLEGRELVRTGPTGSVTKTYDSVGNMTSEAFSVLAADHSPLAAKKWSYRFDLVGNRIGATDPEGGVYKYCFDKLNRLVKLDPPARNDEVKFAFDPAGRLRAVERPGVKTTNTFDSAGRLLKLKHERDQGKEKTVATREYTYSPVGNRISTAAGNNEKTLYNFNDSDWLTRVRYPDGQQVSYDYNGAGDRTEEKIETPTIKGRGRHQVIGTDTQVIAFSYDPAGRMVSRGTDSFLYDADGNLFTALESGNEQRFAWSADNRLLKVEKDIDCPKHRSKHCKKCPQTLTVSEQYEYLPQDWRRITRKTGDLELVSIFDGDDESGEYLVKEVKAKGWKCKKHKKCKCPPPPPVKKLELVREFIGGPGTDDLEFTKYHGRYLAHLKDGLGSTIALTNRDGHAIARIGYDAFGNFRWPNNKGHLKPPCNEKDLGEWLDRFDVGRSFGFQHDAHHWGRHFSSAISPYLFTGRRWDGFTGQYFNRNRYMNPKYGRFTSRDPIGFGGDLNLYRYAANNPLVHTDPFGLFSFYTVGSLKQYPYYYINLGRSGQTEIKEWGIYLEGQVEERSYAQYDLSVPNDQCKEDEYLKELKNLGYLGFKNKYPGVTITELGTGIMAYDAIAAFTRFKASGPLSQEVTLNGEYKAEAFDAWPNRPRANYPSFFRRITRYTERALGTFTRMDLEAGDQERLIDFVNAIKKRFGVEISH